MIILEPFDERWIKFINSKAEANVFHHPAWSSLLVESYGYRPCIIAVDESDGSICAGLPLMKINSILTGRRWVSLPFTDYCVPLYRDDESLNRLTDGLISFSNDNGARRLELRWEFPSRPAIQTYSQHVLHTLPISLDVDSVYKHLQRRLQERIRQIVRDAEKNDLRVEWGKTEEHLRLFYRLHLNTRRKHGVPVQPLKFFSIIEKHIFRNGLGAVLLAYKGKICVAGMVVLFWHKTLIFKYIASDVDYLDLYPNHLIAWNAINWACENGFSFVDMGRSDTQDTGLRDYKSRWGAVEKALIYGDINGKPLKLTSSKMMTILNLVIRKSPVWVCRASGELLFRHFG